MRRPWRDRRALALLLLVTLAGLACSTNTQKRDERLAKAEAYLEKGKVNEALLEFRGALRLDPQNSDLNFRIARLFLTKGDARSALFFFREAGRLDPKRLDAPIEEATILFLEDPDAADALVDKVLEADPTYAPAYVVRSKAALVRVDLDAALRAALTAVELAPEDPITHTQVGKAYQGRIRKGQLTNRPAPDGVFEAALAAYQRAHELSDESSAWLGLQHRSDVLGAWPGHAREAKEAHREAMAAAEKADDYVARDTTIGSALNYAVNTGDLAFHTETLEAFVELHPRAINHWFQLATVEEARGGSREEVLGRMLEVLRDDPEANMRYALDLIEQGRFEEGFAHLKESAEEGIDPPSLLSVLVARLLERRQVGEAEKIVERLEREFPGRPEAQLARAALDFDRGLVDEATEQLRALVGSYRNAAAWQLLAQAEQRRGNLTEAVEAISEAIDIARAIGAPLPERALRLQAHLHTESGNWQAALQSFATLHRAGARLAPRDQVLRARALFGLGRSTAAKGVLRPLILRKRPYAPAAIEFAEQTLTEYPPGALLAIERTLETDPSHPGLLLWAARLHLAMGEPQRAVDRVQVAIQAKRATPALMLERARALAVTGNLEQAQRDALLALERDPNLEGAIPVLMAILEGSDEGKAIESFEEAEAVGALQPSGRYLLARLHTRVGNEERARALLEDLADSDVAGAKNDLAYLLAREGEELNRAQGLAEEAARELRGRPEAVHTLGYVFLRKKLYGPALEQFRFALSNTQDAPGIAPLVHYHMGLALQGLNQLDEAEEEFAQALALDEGMAEAERALEEVRAAKNRGGPDTS